MLDLEKELRRMSEAYGIPEKEVVSWWRTAVRQMFSSSVFYRKYIEDQSTLVKNENTRSMKRYPMVKRFTCAICGEQFGSGGIELDHIDGGNTNKSLADADSFMKAIMFVTPDDVQVLCKDKHKTVNKKKVFVSFGCHSIKTMQESHGCSFEEARVRKEHKLCVTQMRVEDELKLRGIEVTPKTKSAKNELLLVLMLEELEERKTHIAEDIVDEVGNESYE